LPPARVPASGSRRRWSSARRAVGDGATEQPLDLVKPPQLPQRRKPEQHPQLVSAINRPQLPPDPPAHRRSRTPPPPPAPRSTARRPNHLAGRQDLRLDPSHVHRTLERVPQLSAEQRDAVVHATTRDDLALIAGRAGAAKTTAAATIADAYREAGYAVCGAALAGKAADTLQQEAGIPFRTLHSWEYAWEHRQDRLDAGTVLAIVALVTSAAWWSGSQSGWM
jgi:AAA domain